MRSRPAASEKSTHTQGGPVPSSAGYTSSTWRMKISPPPKITRPPLSCFFEKREEIGAGSKLKTFRRTKMRKRLTGAQPKFTSSELRPYAGGELVSRQAGGPGRHEKGNPHGRLS